MSQNRMKRELDLSLSFDLCSAPKASVSSSEPKRATRVSVSSKAEFDGLVIKKPDYERQYVGVSFFALYLSSFCLSFLVVPSLHLFLFLVLRACVNILVSSFSRPFHVLVSDNTSGTLPFIFLVCDSFVECWMRRSERALLQRRCLFENSSFEFSSRKSAGLLAPCSAK